KNSSSYSTSADQTLSSANPGSITRIDFHFPLRKRNQKQTLIPMMCAVANTQHQYTLPPSSTVIAVGITMSGHARRNVSIVTNFVSPAPRSANANDRLIASASENAATHRRSPGTILAMASYSSGLVSLLKTASSTPGSATYTNAMHAMYPNAHR